MDNFKNIKTPNTNKTHNLIQQTLNRNMFERTRSNSLGAIPTENENPVINQSGPIEQTIITQTDSSNQEDTDINEWQRDKPKKRKETSPINNTNKKQKNISQFAIPTENRFELLDDDTIQAQEINKQKIVYVPKPEPIFVTGVINIASLKEVLNKILDNDLYTMTTLRSGHIIKIIPKDIQTYKIIREHFIANNVSHYTYQLKSEKAYRVVLRGLHASEDTTAITRELEHRGHKVRQIVSIRHRSTKEPLPIFYVDLEPQQNNKEIFDVRYLNQMKITIEAPYKKKEIIQCKRCQRFGHTKNQCFRPYRCVKCGNEHPTTQCIKKPDTEATCANCNEKHPASYKGCKIYKQYKERILKVASKPQQKQPIMSLDNNRIDNSKSQYQFQQTNPSKTYAEITKTRQQTLPAQKNNTQHNMTNDFNNFTNIMETMLENIQHTMITILEKMMDKMLDRMVQLVSSLLKK